MLKSLKLKRMELLMKKRRKNQRIIRERMIILRVKTHLLMMILQKSQALKTKEKMKVSLVKNITSLIQKMIQISTFLEKDSFLVRI
jgi:hypothetical protein